ncbi:hypothetical protein [Limnohabitans planktonicus]|nr:hypothetical protein [Limnohabitans planktonicus]|eukprot:gene43142-53550_t
MSTLHGMTQTPKTPPVPNHQNAPHEADPLDLFMPALQDAIEQLEVMHAAWWRVNDALLLLRNMETVDPTFMPDALVDLKFWSTTTVITLDLVWPLCCTRATSGWR